ncbi:ComF family protein [Thermotoga sp. SG1]|uniref:ComF family protein n=1 Tax=Thermotoga sp. SG1 TaxID=126739 RepID=UPI000C75C9CE|nr:ComF family protein [Thermotoga sp. SG1]PLV55811.1 competence protein ComFC [Thermotoga sp. SG1]
MLNFLYTNTCLLCEREISPFSSLCERCRTEIIEKGPSFYHERHRSYEIFVYSTYADKLEEVIKLYKYHNETLLSGFLTEIFIRLYGYFQREADIVTWVPSSLSSLEERGFDHMELIAKKFARKLSIPFARVLKNVSEGRQVDREKEERKKLGRFVCQKPPPRRVILLDDVLTTGTSVKDCVQTLLRNGTESVFVYVLAKAR